MKPNLDVATYGQAPRNRADRNALILPKRQVPQGACRFRVPSTERPQMGAAPPEMTSTHAIWDANIAADEMADLPLAVRIVADLGTGDLEAIAARHIGHELILAEGRRDQISANRLKSLVAAKWRPRPREPL